MRARSHPAQFLADPEDAYAVGRHFVVWCRDRMLLGTAMWGVPDEEEVAFLLSLWGMDGRLGEGYEAVTDVSRLEMMGLDAFDQLARAHREERHRELSRVSRHAVISPLSVGGTLVTGFFSRGEVRHERCFFEGRAEAFGWLRHPDAVQVGEEVEALVADAAGGGVLRARLAAYLGQHLRDADVAGAAQAMSLSVRSLQRELGALGTSFRDELSRTRVAEATRLLESSAVKLTAIAERIGCSSPSHFSKLYRRWTGRNPADVRASRNS